MTITTETTRKPPRKWLHRKRIAPVIEEVNRRLLADSHLTVKALADELTAEAEERGDTGIDQYGLGRMLNLSTSSPNWVDMTTLILKAGLTPNQAAQLAGFEVPIAAETGRTLTPEDERVLDLLHTPGLPDRIRRNAVVTLQSTIEGIMETLRSSPAAQLEPEGRRNVG